MHKEDQTNVVAALKRLNGLSRKVQIMTEADDDPARILEQTLAMQGHLKHIQSLVLEKHLQECAYEKLSSKKQKETFIKDLIKITGLSRR